MIPLISAATLISVRSEISSQQMVILSAKPPYQQPIQTNRKVRKHSLEQCLALIAFRYSMKLTTHKHICQAWHMSKSCFTMNNIIFVHCTGWYAIALTQVNDIAMPCIVMS